VLESRPLKALVTRKLEPSVVDKLQLSDEPLPVRITEDKRKGSLILTCRTNDPKLSAKVINLMLDNLSLVVVSSSQRKSQYLQKRIDETQQQLALEGRKLRRFEETHNIADLTEDAKASIVQMSNVEAELMRLNASLKSIDSELASSVDPEALVELKVKRRSEQSSRDYVAAQYAKLKRQMASMPAVGQQYSTLQRRIGVLEKTYEALSEHYQSSALSRVGEDGDYEIIERAEPVKRPVAPRKLWLTVMGGVLGFLLSCVSVYINGGSPHSKRYRS